MQVFMHLMVGHHNIDTVCVFLRNGGRSGTVCEKSAAVTCLLTNVHNDVDGVCQAALSRKACT